MLNFEILGGVRFPVLGITSNIPKKHYFIPILFNGNAIHSNTIIENTDTIHNIHTIHLSTIHYSY